jgi:hypothetical protein
MTASDSNTNENEYRLDLGGSVIALHCHPAMIAPGLVGWFNRPSSPAEAHIDLDLEVIAEPYPGFLPNSLITTKTVSENGQFSIANELITGQYDPATRRGAIRARQILFEMPYIRVLEQILYQAFYSARAASGQDAVLIHSSAVIAHGAGFLFVGPSEAGKSTAAGCSSEHHVLGDEMNLVSWAPDGVMLEGTGFNGTFREKSPGRAPLKAIFLLDKAPEHALREVSIAEATTTLAKEIVPQVGLDEGPTAETLPAMVDAASRILQCVPIRCLEFRPDPGFWPIILRTFGPDAETGPVFP